ncbi:GIY-YIG nuclease family protein [Nocardioides ganghwensis]|uniref:GIY-YIG nuclease family protein n=1 Tax=Nocardioides ganghwensis TaxID=252230 RepID=A0A4Q2S8R9_9ACTN|nr:GIY-YIG nuclease family protein [Nocardioides ganghwensis]MBD3947555.1 GIY-YIG nuclease family protein [Nocardioides ganghwensis]RYB99425.1 GIY-YIG nuclease family protein [Nocardioides ganghwensis]
MSDELASDPEHVGEAPAVHPTTEAYDRRAAVEAILAADDSLTGRIYRYDLEGMSPADIAAAEDNQGVAFVYNYRLQIDALLSGEVPASPWAARSVAAKLRRWLKTLDLSPELRDDITKFEATLQSRAEDPDAQAVEVDKAVAKSKAAENSNTPGVYVYTLPHYLKHRVDEETGKTLLKVGHSARDVYYRAGSAGRLTALPEEPILLRIYEAAESASVEKQFHAWLNAADHSGTRTRRAGAEWFLTSTKFLDRIAQSLGLDIEIVNEFETGDA